MTKPLFMWAGGKNKMLKHYASVDRPSYDYYVEPFFGGGAVFLNESPEVSTINDVNFEIMGIYRAVAVDPEGFIDECMVYAEEYFKRTDRKAYYYDLRKKYWEEQSPSLLYILMKLGFNGIWQTCKASNGLFGTPSGLLNQTKMTQVVDSGNILEWSDRLANTKITSVDFTEVEVPPNSFVYLDPPYRDSFTTYGTGFDDEAQKRVVEYAVEASKHSTVWLANRVVDGDDFFEAMLPKSKFHYFDVTYTAGRRKNTETGYEAKKAREFLCIV